MSLTTGSSVDGTDPQAPPWGIGKAWGSACGGCFSLGFPEADLGARFRVWLIYLRSAGKWHRERQAANDLLKPVEKLRDSVKYTSQNYPIQREETGVFIHRSCGLLPGQRFQRSGWGSQETLSGSEAETGGGSGWGPPKSLRDMDGTQRWLMHRCLRVVHLPPGILPRTLWPWPWFHVGL